MENSNVVALPRLREAKYTIHIKDKEVDLFIRRVREQQELNGDVSFQVEVLPGRAIRGSITDEFLRGAQVISCRRSRRKLLAPQTPAENGDKEKIMSTSSIRRGNLVFVSGTEVENLIINNKEEEIAFLNDVPECAICHVEEGTLAKDAIAFIIRDGGRAGFGLGVRYGRTFFSKDDLTNILAEMNERSF